MYSCVLVAMLMALSGCGESNEQGNVEAPPPKQETVFDDLTATKERARQGAEQAVQQSKERVDAAVESGESNRAQ
jgi:predicted small lipoprotein YifL